MPPLEDAALLNARQDVGDARQRIIDSGLPLVVVRRTVGLVIFWYAFDAQSVLERLGVWDGPISVEDALGLHESMSSPVGDIDSMTPEAPSENTVVLDGGRFVGVRQAEESREVARGEAAEPEPAESEAAEPEAEEPDGAEPGSAPSPPSRRVRRMVHRSGSSGGRPRRARRGLHLPVPSVEGERAEEAAESAPEAGETAAAEPSPAPLPAPEETTPFTAFPRLDAPPTVAPRTQFKITIGLARRLTPGTSGGPVTVDLPSRVKRFKLGVLVIAEGFGMPDGGRHSFEVDRSNPYANSIDVRLVAPDAEGIPLLTTISVLYFYEDVPCGLAHRKTAVVPEGAMPDTDVRDWGTLWAPDPEDDCPISVQGGLAGIDLTVVLSKPDDDESTSRYAWSFRSPHDVVLPIETEGLDLGASPAEFARSFMEEIQASEDAGALHLEMRGVGTRIAAKLPEEFQPLLRAVAEAVDKAEPGRLPTVLFLTAESHVPWELALLDPPLNKAVPHYLGCQVNMARWPFPERGVPALPPPSSIDVSQLAVVAGDYDPASGWRKLEKAEHEASTLASDHGAVRLPAKVEQMVRLLSADFDAIGVEGGVELLHFACHGEAVDIHAMGGAIILDSGERVRSTWFLDADLGDEHSPFLFLNACQIGRAGDVLGSFSGFAGDSLRGGFRGFIGPLWSVDDKLACEIALEFYERALGAEGKDPEPVGDVLRSLRARFKPDAEKKSSTRLAYAFYGHPSLTLNYRRET